jgi:hypothetical protein
MTGADAYARYDAARSAWLRRAAKYDADTLRHQLDLLAHAETEIRGQRDALLFLLHQRAKGDA